MELFDHSSVAITKKNPLDYDKSTSLALMGTGHSNLQLRHQYSY